MKYLDLEQLANEGRLFVRKSIRYTNKRFKPYPSKELTSYTVYYYNARTKEMPEGQFYKILAKDYKKLLLAGAKEI